MSWWNQDQSIRQNLLRLACQPGRPLSRYQPEIERGLGDTIVDALLDHLDDYMGRAYAGAFRQHLRRLAP